MQAAALRSFTIYAPDEDAPDLPPRGPLLKDLLRRYFATHPAIGPKAAGQYRNAVNLARRWLLTATAIQTADERSVARKPTRTDCEELFSLPVFCDFARGLCTGRAPATVNGRVDVLWMLWAFAHDEGLCTRPLPPASKKPRWKERRPDPVAFTLDQVEKLIAACVLATPMAKCPWWTSEHWVALVCTFLATSERFEALLLCPRAALQGNVLTVPARLTKDGKENPVVLQQAIADKLRRLPPIGDSPLFFPYPFRLKTLRERFDLDILAKANLPRTRRHKFHCLRRTSITQIYIVQGLEAARRSARHAGQGLTLSRYVSQSVVEQQTGVPNFDVPVPRKLVDKQKLLFS